MKRFIARSVTLLSILCLMVTACVSEDAPPPVVPPGNVGTGSGNGTYLNIMTKSVEFNGQTGDPDGVGELQFIVIVSDDRGHSDALICPYGGVIEIQTGDLINPCNAGLSYPQDVVEGNLYIMIIAMDIDETGTAGDLTTGILTSGLALGLEKAIIALGLVVPESVPVIIGLLALDVVIGYAGNEVQEYFEQSDVLGSQSFVLPGTGSWNNGHPIIARSANGDVEFSFTVEQSSTPEGKLYADELPEVASLTEVIPLSPSAAMSSTEGILTTVKANNVYLRFGPHVDHSAISGTYKRGEKVEILNAYQDWAYVKVVNDGKIGWLYTGWINMDSIDIKQIATPSSLPPTQPAIVLPTATKDIDNPEPSYP